MWVTAKSARKLESINWSAIIHFGLMMKDGKTAETPHMIPSRMIYAANDAASARRINESNFYSFRRKVRRAWSRCASPTTPSASASTRIVQQREGRERLTFGQQPKRQQPRPLASVRRSLKLKLTRMASVAASARSPNVSSASKATRASRSPIEGQLS